MADPLVEMMTSAEARIEDAYLRIADGDPREVERVLGGLDDFGRLASRIAEVVRIRRGTAQDQKNAALLAAGELREYLARELAKHKW